MIKDSQEVQQRALMDNIMRWIAGVNEQLISRNFPAFQHVLQTVTEYLRLSIFWDSFAQLS